MALAPAHPNTWFVAAFLELRIGDGNYEKICRAWRNSVLLGPHENYLIPRRLRLGLAIEPECGTVVTELFPDQIRWMWRMRRNDLMEMTRSRPTLYAHVLRSLNEDPDAVAAFVLRYNS